MWPTLTVGVMIAVVGLLLSSHEISKVDVTLSIPAKSLRVKAGGVVAIVACVPKVVCGSILMCSTNEVGDRGGDPPMMD